MPRAHTTRHVLRCHLRRHDGGALCGEAAADVHEWAQIVVLPYQMMLHSGTRESMGVRLTNCVVVFDEAHNLLDTINAMYTASLSAQQVGSTPHVRECARALFVSLSEYKCA